ncbi:MAG TPA: redoxin family protein [Bryobacteraceae bacterium]|nr:redoxin family protein [Bryobacteraceae bacterium]
MIPALAGLALLLFVSLQPGRAADLSRGEDRLGLPAPALQLRYWVNAPPLDVQTLRGKVVLIRWWTDGCPFCEATAPALRELDRRYASRGLQVIGIYHPKPPGDWSVAHMRAATLHKQFTFPVALDADWTALQRWWPDLEQRGWTSVSFVLDKKGIIRYVHPGGEYHSARARDDERHARCQRDYQDIEKTITRLLGE